MHERIQNLLAATEPSLAVLPHSARGSRPGGDGSAGILLCCWVGKGGYGPLTLGTEEFWSASPMEENNVLGRDFSMLKP